MTRLQIHLSLAAFLLLLAASSASALDLGGHDRDGTVVGLTFGHGWNSVKYTPNGGAAMESGTVSAFTGGARIGWASSDNVIASIGFYGWKRSYNTFTTTSTTTYHFILEGYYFPRGEGFWVKGGIGRGTLDFYAQAPLPQDSITINEGGWTLSTGAGYEFRVAEGTAFGISYDLIYLPVGDFAVFRDVSAVSHSLSFNLHFYM